MLLIRRFMLLKFLLYFDRVYDFKFLIRTIGRRSTSAAFSEIGLCPIYTFFFGKIKKTILHFLAFSFSIRRYDGREFRVPFVQTGNGQLFLLGLNHNVDIDGEV